MKIHHFINEGGTCHAGDLAEAGTPMKPVYIMSEIQQYLFAYSEWLDGEGIIRNEYESGDDRSHEQLVADFKKEEIE